MAMAASGLTHDPMLLVEQTRWCQFWDGRAPALEEQAKGLIANPIEMGNTYEEVVRRLKSIPGYRDRFRTVHVSRARSPGAPEEHR